MKFRNHVRSGLLIALMATALCGVSQAQKTAALSAVSQTAPDARLEAIVRQSRTQPMTPHNTPPAWLDYDKARLGSEFLKKHAQSIMQTLGTSALAASYAGKDTGPIVIQTGRLPHDFSHRLKETETSIAAMLEPFSSRQAFVTVNLARAYQLGLIHVAVANQVKGSLHWNPKERLPMSQQAFGFVFYTFAWWPVEALADGKQITLENGNPELDGWLHLWCALGYEMGVSEDLLPTSVSRAKEIVALLRKAQYPGVGEKPIAGIPVLLGAHLRWLSEEVAARSTASTSGKTAPEKLLPLIGAVFAQSIKRSPGLADALGLGSDPAAQLIKYAAVPAVEKG